MALAGAKTPPPYDKIKSRKQTMLTTISLFSGIGGLDFGFEAAGFETRLALELDKTACQTIRLNRPWEVIEDDINKVSSQDILSKADIKAREVNLLIGGPPCQPFSKSSYWVRGDTLRLDDPRADTLTGYLRVVRDTLPRVFLIENVAGLAFKEKDEGLQYILNSVEQINRERGSNYTLSWQVLNAALYGVPQRRERVFIVGSREGRFFRFPQATHGHPSEIEQDLFMQQGEPYRTAWDALGDLPEPSPDEPGLKVGGKWGDLLSTIPEGENYLWHTSRRGGHSLFGWRTRYWSFLLKLSKRLPSWTVQAQPGSAIGPFHWKNRRLTFQELCRIQTFPDGLSFNCGRTEMQRMLGNAVPSLLAEVLAREIRDQLLDAPIRSPLRLLPPRRSDTPPPEPIVPLPSKYHHLIDDHPDHPGEGRGRRAVVRKAADSSRKLRTRSTTMF